MSADTNPSNCTDDVWREHYRACLMSKIAHESSLEVARKKGGLHRNNLKAAKRAGVDPEAISQALADRFRDPDEIVREIRNRIRASEVAGVIPDLFGKVSAGHPRSHTTTMQEEAENNVIKAMDQGHLAGRKGVDRAANHYQPGSECWDAWDRAWLEGQRVIADEMNDNVAPAPSRKKPSGEHLSVVH